MAEGQVSVGTFAKGLAKNGKTAIAKAAKKPVKKGLAQVPSGISKGFARFVGLNYGKANNESATPYVTLRFIGLAPNKAKGCSVTRTHYLEENDYATLEEVYERFFNDVKIIGVDCESGDVAEILTALSKAVKDNIIVTFSTQLGKKPKNGGDPRVNVYLNDQATEEEIDELDLDSEPETDEDEEEKPKSKSKSKATSKKEVDEDDEDEDDEDEDDEDAEEEDEEGEEKPNRRRPAPKPEPKKPATRKKKEEVEEEPEDDEDAEAEDEEDGNDQPHVNDVFEIKIGKKKVEVEVLKVNTKAETVNVKELESGKKHMNISWNDLL